MTITLGGLSQLSEVLALSVIVAFMRYGEARGLLPFYANLVLGALLPSYAIMVNALTFTLPPP